MNKSVYEEEIEILDVKEEVEEVKSLLNKESESREDILKMTNEQLLDHTKNLLEYTKTNKSYQALKEKYLKLELENKSNRLKLSECEIELKKQSEENIQLRKEIEQKKKKLVTVQSILQVIINSYGINSIIKIIGIPYIKLKEYLQD